MAKQSRLVYYWDLTGRLGQKAGMQEQEKKTPNWCHHKNICVHILFQSTNEMFRILEWAQLGLYLIPNRNWRKKYKRSIVTKAICCKYLFYVIHCSFIFAGLVCLVQCCPDRKASLIDQTKSENVTAKSGKVELTLKKELMSPQKPAFCS